MRTRRTLPSPDRALPAREPFETPALFDLVATLSIQKPEDLLAPHWMVPDRGAGEERLPRDRFTRRRSPSVARAALALHAEGSRLTARTRHGGEGAMLMSYLAGWPPAPNPRPASSGAAGDRRPRHLFAFAWARGALIALAAWLRRLVGRSAG